MAASSTMSVIVDHRFVTGNQADNACCRGHEPACCHRFPHRCPDPANLKRQQAPGHQPLPRRPNVAAPCERRMSPGYGARVRLRARCPLSAARIASARALTAKGTVPLAGDSQVQDRDSHRIHGLGLLRALTDRKNAGRQHALLVSGSRIFPDTEEVTSSNLAPPTAGHDHN